MNIYICMFVTISLPFVHINFAMCVCVCMGGGVNACMCV